MIEAVQRVEIPILTVAVVGFGALVGEYVWEYQAGIVWLVAAAVAADNIVAQSHSALEERSGWCLAGSDILVLLV